MKSLQILEMGKGIENGIFCAKRIELLDTKVPIALNYLVALKDLLSILEESRIQGGERIREVSSMQVNNI